MKESRARLDLCGGRGEEGKGEKDVAGERAGSGREGGGRWTEEKLVGRLRRKKDEKIRAYMKNWKWCIVENKTGQ